MSERILIVDDEPDIVDVLAEILGEEGYELATAFTGEDAVAQFDGSSFDLVISDMRLPEMDGMGVLQHVKETKPDTEVIIMTGYGTLDNAIEALRKYNAFDYLSKPLEDLDKLLNAVRQSLDMRSLRISNRAKQAALEESNARVQASQKKYRKLIRNMLNGFALHEIVCEDDGVPCDYRFLAVNPAFEAITGVRADTLLGKTAREVWPETESYWVETYGDVAIHGQSVRFENYFGALGKYFEVLAYSPRPGQFATVFTDITDRKRADIALRESEARFKAIIEYAPNGILLSDPNSGRLELANQKMADLLGTETESFKGRHWLDISAQIQAEGRLAKDLLPDLGGGVEEGRVTLREWIFVDADDKEVLTELRLTRLPAAERQIIQTSVLDITAKRRLEEQMLQAQKMEAIGTMAGGIAHEFNNLLGIIMGNTELALDDVPSWNAARPCLEEIQQASTRAKEVVRQILNLSRQRLGVHRAIHLVPLIKDSLKLLRASIPAKIEVHTEFDCARDRVAIDPTQINQVLLSLLTNASHAMQARGGSLTVRVTNLEIVAEGDEHFPDAKPGDYTCTAVADTGHGIPVEIQKRIFDPYFTTKGIGEGSGIGLAVVRGIVSKNNGSIHMHSRVGQGTVFKVIFPCSPKLTESLPTPVLAKSSGGKRLMVIDDEEGLLKLYQVWLERQGYIVDTFNDPQAGIAAFEQEPQSFDLILTDMSMPTMTGIDLIRRMHGVREDVPFMLCSGYSDLLSPDKELPAYVAAVLTKPMGKNELLGAIEQIFITLPG